ncbi:hypothetical protein EGR_10525 [Echinococcus granulosus]|uniref:Uncharacterized protein n=1 Tax=Echinococcus granulosus TaxID=6210 RepID=W6U0Q7_ECHGR|nr:hypothetical protein EGR_10525 [Echinococcus granulosus]EUB54618.1 hypothetical protein EGR_10525 [Echinococcus granulosus]
MASYKRLRCLDALLPGIGTTSLPQAIASDTIAWILKLRCPGC